MSLDLDLGGDATALDGVEAVQYVRRSDLPSGTGETIAHALRRPIQTIEGTRGKGWSAKNVVHSDGVYAAADAYWTVPVAELAEEPTLGDVIVDSASRRWTVLEFHAATLNSRWICRARELAIAEGLEDLVAVLLASETTGDDGTVTTTWTVEHENLRTRIQFDEAKIEDNDGVMKTTRNYTIFFETAVALDHTRRICGPGGSLYRVVSAVGYPRLGELMTAKCEAIE